MNQLSLFPDQEARRSEQTGRFRFTPWPDDVEPTGALHLGSWNAPIYAGEFWTSRQRQASSLHEVSYRACFKPQLPAFFIERFTSPDDAVYDPFGGRGTTAVEAALRGRRVISNDVNPLSRILTEPRLELPDLEAIQRRLQAIPMNYGVCAEIDLSMFFHPRTEAEIVSLRNYLAQRRENGEEDAADRWIRMVATNRLTGHSRGFFSVYTLPPNQAVSAERQKKINEKLGQTPDYRDTRRIIYEKSRQLQSSLTPQERANLRAAAASALYLTEEARSTPQIASESVRLTVTSPPFLDVVQYADDNWLRCWFNGIDAQAVEKRITLCRKVEDWAEAMRRVFGELYRITRPDGWVAFEVGEIRNGKIRLEEAIAPVGIDAGFHCEAVMINRQTFTKTANIWGVKNNRLGTNTNRIVLFRKRE
jgi:hypothetical protein